ncbi:phage holin family protein [Vannielia litorea]|nr:phage holin family protein [Vannielia litorea]
MLARLQMSLAHAMRRVAFSAGAGICFLVGAAFMTVAGWIYLVETTSTQTAALIVGAVWLALGFVLLGMSRIRRVPPVPVAQPTPVAGPLGLAEAFIVGLQAGRGTSKGN